MRCVVKFRVVCLNMEQLQPECAISDATKCRAAFNASDSHDVESRLIANPITS